MAYELQIEIIFFEANNKNTQYIACLAFRQRPDKCVCRTKKALTLFGTILQEGRFYDYAYLEGI